VTITAVIAVAALTACFGLLMLCAASVKNPTAASFFFLLAILVLLLALSFKASPFW
jgi:hypothetical protein